MEKLQAKSLEVERSDFGKLLEELQVESKKSQNLISILTNQVSGIKELRNPPTKTEDVADKPPVSFLDYAWDEIWKIRKSNNQLEIIVDHLNTIVG